KLNYLGYESLWTAGTGAWNYITEDYVPRAAELLCELLTYRRAARKDAGSVLSKVSKRAMAGYSGKPLAEKLGIKAGCSIFLDRAPENYRKLVEPLPEGVSIVPRLADKVDIVHVFSSEAKELAKKLKQFKKSIVENGMIWVSWPKKSAGVPTDVTED